MAAAQARSWGRRRADQRSSVDAVNATATSTLVAEKAPARFGGTTPPPTVPAGPGAPAGPAVGASALVRLCTKARYSLGRAPSSTDSRCHRGTAAGVPED